MASLTFSVVIPVRNERGSLGACLEALARQSFPAEDVEVLVVDGHSTDGTAELAESFGGVRVIADGGVSVGEARNRGIAVATGDVVAFTDGDCVPREDWLERLAARFEREPGAAGVGGGLRMPDHGNSASWSESVGARALYRGFITSNVAYRRADLAEVGGFDARLRCGEDFDLWWRFLDAGKRVVFEPTAIVEHRCVEIESLPRYYARHFWYARNDVHTFASRAATMIARERGGAHVAWREPLQVAYAAMLQGAGVAALAAAPVAGPGAAALGAGLLAVEAGEKAVRARLAGEVGILQTAAFAGAFAARGVVRGAGTLVGLADVALRAARRSAGAKASSPPPASRPRAIRGPSRRLV